MDDIKSFEPLWGSWYIKEVLGEGGFGKVYRIERQEFHNTYVAALKHIRVPQSQSEVKNVMYDGMDEANAVTYFEGVVEDLVEEFTLMSKLKGNSNIVSYEDHLIVKNPNLIQWDIFIRMELLTSLNDYFAQKEITKSSVIKLGIDICKALEICQKHNIIHRDIKPENIFVSDNGDFKLGDFGIARQIEKTMSGLSKKGTFTYIAPEVYKGEAYGSSVDIYSLGMVMYRMLNNNRTPFLPPYPQPITRSDKEAAMVKRINGTPLPPPLNADGTLARIVLQACAYNPRNRFTNPTAMRKALESILYTTDGKIVYPKNDTIKLDSVHYVSTNHGNSSNQTGYVSQNSGINKTNGEIKTSAMMNLFEQGLAQVNPTEDKTAAIPKPVNNTIANARTATMPINSTPNTPQPHSNQVQGQEQEQLQKQWQEQWQRQRREQLQKQWQEQLQIQRRERLQKQWQEQLQRQKQEQLQKQSKWQNQWQRLVQNKSNAFQEDTYNGQAIPTQYTDCYGRQWKTRKYTFGMLFVMVLLVVFFNIFGILADWALVSSWKKQGYILTDRQKNAVIFVVIFIVALVMFVAIAVPYAVNNGLIDSGSISHITDIVETIKYI